jgi:hypothetical protein
MVKLGILFGLAVALAAPAQANTFGIDTTPAFEHAREVLSDGEWMKVPKFGKVKGPKLKMVKVKRPKYGGAVKRRGWGPPDHAVAWGYRYRAPARSARWR